MKTAIVYSPDPVYLSPFILRVLRRYPEAFAAVIKTKGSIVRRKSRLEQIEYLLALPFILGPLKTLHNFGRIAANRLARTDPIEQFCGENGIPTLEVKTVNSQQCRQYLASLDCDVIFNQSHHILKRDVLDIPKIGVLNRHGAPLPHYRGRLAPFWQIMNGETHGGLTYHLLDEGIDSGPIVYQDKIPITPQDNVNTLIDKMFDLAVERFGTVLEMLARPGASAGFIENPPDEGSYYSSPRLKDALKYHLMRLGMLRRDHIG